MALTPLRWAAAALGGMLLVLALVLYFPEPPLPTPLEQARELKRIEASAARGRLNVFATQYRMAHLTDSLRRVGGSSDSAAVRVSLSPSLPASTRTLFDTAVARATRRLSGTRRVPILFVAVAEPLSIDSRQIPVNGIVPFYILPERRGDPCIAVARVGQNIGNDFGRVLNSDAAAEQLFGPCAFYAAFGMPGSHVRDWLRGRGAWLAMGGSLTELRQYRSNGWTKYFTMRTADWYHPRLEFMSLRGTRCSNGEWSECEATLLEPRLSRRVLVVGPAVSPLVPLGPSAARWTDYGPGESEIVAGMVRMLGRERFQAFWSSNEPVPVAFAQASGSSLQEWIRRWADEVYGVPVAGPRLPAFGLVAAGLIAFACLVAAMQLSARREFA